MSELVETLAALLYRRHPMFLGQRPVPWEALTPGDRVDRANTAKAALAVVEVWVRETGGPHNQKHVTFIATAIRQQLDAKEPPHGR